MMWRWKSLVALVVCGLIDANTASLNRCDEGKKMPSPLQCSSYLMCEGGHLVEKRCLNDELYDIEEGTCRKANQVDCFEALVRNKQINQGNGWGHNTNNKKGEENNGQGWGWGHSNGNNKNNENIFDGLEQNQKNKESNSNNGIGWGWGWGRNKNHKDSNGHNTNQSQDRSESSDSDESDESNTIKNLDSSEKFTKETPTTKKFVEKSTQESTYYPTIELSGSSTISSAGECQGTCPDFNIPPTYLPHKNCSKFCECEWGKPHIMNCPKGLHFNPSINVCDLPKNAGCQSDEALTEMPTTASTLVSTKESTPSTMMQSFEQTGTEESIQKSTVTRSPSDDHTHHNISQSFEDFSSPETTEEPTEHLTQDFSTDLTAISTSNITIIPTRETFGTTKNLLDESTTRSSSSTNLTNFTDELTEVPTEISTILSSQASSQENTDSSTKTATQDSGIYSTSTIATTSFPYGCQGTCPVNNNQPTYIPHINCTKFCQCEWGTIHILECPSGLHFNPLGKVCDLPKNAGCEVNENQTDFPTTWNSSNKTSPESTEQATEKQTENPTEEFPNESTEIQTALPQEESTGESSEEHTNHTTMQPFDSTIGPESTAESKEVTDYSTSLLTKKPTVLPTHRPTERETHQTATQEISTTAVTTEQSINNITQEFTLGSTELPTKKPTIIPTNTPTLDYTYQTTEKSFEESTAMSNPTKQTTENATFTGKPSEITTQMPTQVSTQEDFTKEPTEEPTYKPTQESADYSTSGSTEKATTSFGDECQGSCPVDNNPPTYLAHIDCTKFCQCEWGKAHIMNCPKGLHFNPSIKVCVLPDNAGCQVNTIFT